MLAVQAYLAHCWVKVEEEDGCFVVSLTPKDPNAAVPTSMEFGNALLEAAFIHQRSRETAPLLAALLARAFSIVQPR